MRRRVRLPFWSYQRGACWSKVCLLKTSNDASVRHGPWSARGSDTTRLPEAIVPPPTVWQVSNDGGGGFSVGEHGWPAPADAAGPTSSAPRIGARPVATLPQEISLI